MRRPGLLVAAALGALVVVGVVVVSLVDTDDAPTTAYLETERLEPSDRATELCRERGPAMGRMTLSHASSTTAGEVADVMRAFGRPAAPWDELPADRYVARCSYIEPGGGTSPTTTCADGDTVETNEPVQFLVDDHGTVTPDITPPPTDYCGD